MKRLDHILSPTWPRYTHACTLYVGLYIFAACFCAATIWGLRLFIWRARRYQRRLDKVRNVRVKHWRLLDAVSSTRSLSDLLSAIETRRTTRMAPALFWWPPSEIIRTRVRVPRILAAATIWKRRLFRSELPILSLLFKGGVYSEKYTSQIKTTSARHTHTILCLTLMRSVITGKVKLGNSGHSLILTSLLEYSAKSKQWRTC